MANYYIFLSNKADILREMGAFIQASDEPNKKGKSTNRN